MFKIITDRLSIIPLDKEKLELCINNYSDMEKTLGLNSTGLQLSGRQKSVYNIRLKGVTNNTEKYMWFTVWVIVLNDLNTIIGSIMIKGYPNVEGEVVVGYSIEENYRCKGYMTEALKATISWIFENEEVKSIVADTLKDNLTSQGVLRRIGMKIYKEDDECFWWKLNRNLT